MFNFIGWKLIQNTRGGLSFRKKWKWLRRGQNSSPLWQSFTKTISNYFKNHEYLRHEIVHFTFKQNKNTKLTNLVPKINMNQSGKNTFHKKISLYRYKMHINIKELNIQKISGITKSAELNVTIVRYKTALKIGHLKIVFSMYEKSSFKNWIKTYSLWNTKKKLTHYLLLSKMVASHKTNKILQKQRVMRKSNVSKSKERCIRKHNKYARNVAGPDRFTWGSLSLSLQQCEGLSECVV